MKRCARRQRDEERATERALRGRDGEGREARRPIAGARAPRARDRASGAASSRGDRTLLGGGGARAQGRTLATGRDSGAEGSRRGDARGRTSRRSCAGRARSARVDVRETKKGDERNLSVCSSDARDEKLDRAVRMLRESEARSSASIKSASSPSISRRAIAAKRPSFTSYEPQILNLVSQFCATRTQEVWKKRRERKRVWTGVSSTRRSSPAPCAALRATRTRARLTPR